MSAGASSLTVRTGSARARCSNVDVEPGAPSRLRLLIPARDVPVGTLAALFAVGAVGDDVVRAVLTGKGIEVIVAPGILGNGPLFPVRPVPVGDRRRGGDERLQAFLRSGIAADLELEQIERLADLSDLDLRRLALRFFAPADEIASDDAHDDADQNEHHEDFDQRHAARGRASCNLTA